MVSKQLIYGHTVNGLGFRVCQMMDKKWGYYNMFKLTRSDGDLLEIMTKTENQVITHAVLKRPAQIMAPCPQKHIPDVYVRYGRWLYVNVFERIVNVLQGTYVYVGESMCISLHIYICMYIMFIHNYKLFIYIYIYIQITCVYYIVISYIYIYASLYARINVCTYPPEATGHAPRRHANPLHSGLLR